MDLFLYFFEDTIYFAVASIPLIMAFLQLKIFKLPPKTAAYCLLLNLIVSIFFWVKLKDGYLAVYQSIPYVLIFIWIFLENKLRKMEENKGPEEDSDK